MTTYFSTEQLDGAIGYVAHRLTVGLVEWVPYAEALAATGLEVPAGVDGGEEPDLLSSFVSFFHERSIALGLPPFDAVLVHSGGSRAGKPGVVYFHAHHHLDPFSGVGSAASTMSAEWHWEEQVRQVRDWVRRYVSQAG